VTATDCPLCAVPADRFIYADELVVALWDAYAVSPGHALVVPRRHVASWFDATREERAALTDAVQHARAAIERRHRPDGYNIGVNVGAAAGQTVFHLHVHVIPRYLGDVTDPRGGVRAVIPGRANYLTAGSITAAPWIGEPPHERALVSGGTDDPLLPHLVAHLDRATAVDIAVAFTLTSGVSLLEPHLRDVLERGGRVRLLTGDYLGVTEPDALLRLTDLQGDVQLRVFESAGRSFHPKAYIVAAGGDGGTAFVGSSNLSATALQQGVEWNYRVLTDQAPAGFFEVRAGFDALFQHPKTRPLDVEWIEAYRRRRASIVVPPSGIAPDPVPPPPEPHTVQREALAALDRARREGSTAGLVVLATGLGKTWLSAFDSVRFQRVLFVAHREEILGQAMRTFRAIRPSAVLGHYTGTEKTPNADILFASIQTLGRSEHLERFSREDFDYIVVDEFHHAAARTYRRLIDYFRPTFLLGLTATPERTDGGDLLALCGENVVYRCDLVEGIRRGLLSPFDYFGVPDDVDYQNIPWRSNRFDETELTNALATQARAENALEQFRQRGGSRTLGFCVSQRHADFMADYFRGAGLRAVAVHSGERTAPRAHSLEQLGAGELDVLFAVDMFNEGVDLPAVDTVMMLRPTESQIIWLQQFGRGLRWQAGKRLTVIDYIGNHRAFLIKPRTLLQLGAGDAEVRYALDSLDAGMFELPPGCSVTYELEAKDMLRALLRIPARGEALRSYYLDFRERHGIRPLAVEADHDGYDPKSARPAHASWLAFVRAMGGLNDEQVQVNDRFAGFLDALETTPMTKSYKMVVLLAILAEGALPGSIGIERLATRFADLARRYALVRTEVGAALDDPAELRKLLEGNPIDAWVGGRGTAGTSYFAYDGGTFASTLTVPPHLRGAFQDLVREIAEWRLAVYLRRVGGEAGADRIVCKVSHAGGKPILFYAPGRDKVGGIPEGWREVMINGEPFQANFVKIAVNVVTRPGSSQNVLPDILRDWFGPSAGEPGTAQHVIFQRTEGGGYTLSPLGDIPVPSGPLLWQPYTRAQVADRFGLKFVGWEEQQGIVTRPGLILLFVTLDKTTMVEAHRYRDQFLSAGEFQWQSQNRTTQASTLGQDLQHHAERGIHVHLCVRVRAKANGRTVPFTYCGELVFERWEGEKPITVWWRMQEPVPVRLWGELGIK
jgi:superfamily II DNA or RNA helicase/diadenosine tetraphosphate (Ap4A) HIT family hydrolase